MFRVTNQPIDLNELVRYVADAEAGAIVAVHRHDAQQQRRTQGDSRSITTAIRRWPKKNWRASARRRKTVANLQDGDRAPSRPRANR